MKIAGDCATLIGSGKFSFADAVQRIMGTASTDNLSEGDASLTTRIKEECRSIASRFVCGSPCVQMFECF